MGYDFDNRIVQLARHIDMLDRRMVDKYESADRDLRVTCIAHAIDLTPVGGDPLDLAERLYQWARGNSGDQEPESAPKDVSAG